MDIKNTVGKISKDLRNIFSNSGNCAEPNMSYNNLIDFMIKSSDKLQELLFDIESNDIEIDGDLYEKMNELNDYFIDFLESRHILEEIKNIIK